MDIAVPSLNIPPWVPALLGVVVLQTQEAACSQKSNRHSQFCLTPCCIQWGGRLHFMTQGAEVPRLGLMVTEVE